tara:strand:+ start:84665 stop:85024 length:360 start_codon:yes stop_codon:yes gene_type:complete
MVNKIVICHTSFEYFKEGDQYELIIEDKIFKPDPNGTSGTSGTSAIEKFEPNEPYFICCKIIVSMEEHRKGKLKSGTWKRFSYENHGYYQHRYPLYTDYFHDIQKYRDGIIEKILDKNI